MYQALEWTQKQVMMSYIKIVPTIMSHEKFISEILKLLIMKEKWQLLP